MPRYLPLAAALLALPHLLMAASAHRASLPQMVERVECAHRTPAAVSARAKAAPAAAARPMRPGEPRG
ncbi:hypothetical protein [Lysobacter antibioticus]|uniref:hypothetical protein n=1 Tax=Lysobacter antibioticus TaxID=84531 RepID=UPI00034B8E34|nr:hypothetical protein [Lysobacter antibioticus]